MTFDINVFGLDADDLSRREKEELAEHTHRFIQEQFDLHPETIAVEGYMEEDQ